MPVPNLIHPKHSSVETMPPATVWAVAALQRAMLSVIKHWRARDAAGVRALLEDSSAPRSFSEWERWLEESCAHLPSPIYAAAFVLGVQSKNAALEPYRDVLAASALSEALARLMARLTRVESGSTVAAGHGLIDQLLEPARRHPDDLMAQVAYVLRAWRAHLSESDIAELLRAEDIHREHTSFRGGEGFGPPPVEVADFGHGRPEQPATGLPLEDDGVRFSHDRAWMKQLVMMAKHTYVWLDQLSRRFGAEIRTLDAIPDEELASLAASGVNGVWLIGVWERSHASRVVKQRMGNTAALASAYSVWDYVVADALGGEPALEELKRRAWTHGIRIGADMVPNHTAIDGRWVAEHPERFVQTATPPFPNYTFSGPNLSSDDRVGVFLEDGYWSKTDAAVVFRHVENRTGRVRFVYHGNDGTVMPWNDTAQLDFTRSETREAVIETLVAVARRFPILRLDAAMTLARKHVQRLWYPPPGQGGAIPSRAAHGRTAAEFDAMMPREFWVEVVEQVAERAPDTLLLAEAFWMMEEYFVRSLGMHRVYHSAFMHMLRDGDNAGFRKILRDMMAYSPAVLERYANFLSNPDEETAAQQFGTMDRYFTAATLQATLPGLPMLGHGQLEGSREKYGMEAARAHEDEAIDEGLLAHHETVIFPLLRDRGHFASTERFHLFDHAAADGSVNEDVYAYTNVGGDGRRSLVLVNHGGTPASGSIRLSCPRNEGSIEAPELVSRTLAEALGLGTDAGVFYAFREQRSGLMRLRRGQDLHRGGLAFDLDPYESRIFWDFEELRDESGRLQALHDELAGRPVHHLDAPKPAGARLPVRDVDPTRAVAGGLAPAIPPRGAGVLLHPSSLPGPELIGTLGQASRDLVSWMASAGLRYWQVLPLCEGGPGDSPYSSPASRVGSPWLIDLMDLHQEGLLDDESLSLGMAQGGGDVDFERVRQVKEPLLRKAARALLSTPQHSLYRVWREWLSEREWVMEVALFGELRADEGGSPWWLWPAPLRDRRVEALAEARERLGDRIEERAVLAFFFDRQWGRLRRLADENGVLIIGDLPIYVSHDSADAWLDQDLFEFAGEGRLQRVAGVPPDAFSETGQLWGNPLYDWSQMAQDDFAWWVARLQRCLEWTPVLRIDHFRAFSAYWAVPAAAETAMEGAWVAGPGLGLFQAFRRALGPQWLLAEDLGEIDAPVHQLRAQAGMLCTRVLQFAYGGSSENLHLPANVPADAVMYTGTHDNNTTLGWWNEASAAERRHVMQVVCEEPSVDDFVLAALASAAQLVIVPMQDVLGLDASGRMNVPGTGEGNWAWRMRGGELGTELSKRVADWLRQTGRGSE